MLLTLALAACLQDARPLLTAPAAWRTERLEFPLSFAPELAQRGHEDLAFAPGMFQPESDSYFSYALALRLEGDVAVDAAWLQRFLEGYYRGLCRAVAEERKLERDASTIAARVERDGDLFRATIEMFDPFTTGNELDLRLELHTHAAVGATEVLGLASPFEDEAPVWGHLRTIARAWREARPPPVFLNHVYAVVDAETYAALAAEPFLREVFAVSEERTTVRADLTYQGLYFYGQRTYFEFLAPAPAAGLVEGGAGLALGVETTGALAEFAKRLESRGIRTQSGPITREFEGRQVPWFQILGLEMPSTQLNLFALEYERDFLASFHPGLAPRAASIERAAILERYAASLGKSELRASALLGDVVEARCGLGSSEREALTRVAEAAGFTVTREAASCRIEAPQVRFVLDPAESSAGLVSLTMTLKMPLERAPIALGRYRLNVSGTHAVLERRR